MTPSHMIASIAQAAYLTGADGVSVGVAFAEIIAEETLGLDCQDPQTILLARRIVGALLDCGWSAPVLIPKAAE